MSEDMGIDLGTANTLVHVKNRGIVIREPSVVAIEINTNEVLAIGAEAKRMLGRAPGNIMPVRPMRDGVISDYETAQAMLKYFIKRAMRKNTFIRPRVLVGVPSGVTEVQKRAVIDAALEAGAREAYLIEEPMAAAIGAGLPVQDAWGNVIVDIGGGTCEVAVISLGGIVEKISVHAGGDALDKAIQLFIRKKYDLLIGERTAEEIKIEVGDAMYSDNPLKMEICGRDLRTGLPKNLVVTSNDVCEAIDEPVRVIVNAVISTLEKTPPELAADIMSNGIIMTGGTSLLRNLDRFISSETKIPVFVSEDALSCVALGTGVVVENIDAYRKGFLIES
ncbi:MAG: rod shape-determining protein [Phascolarctobacterium sp.]|nr:rod shape-determining protein [Candidatus Phascolarctobacterium caballi]MCQ2380791.1 rod shape-determining protein [Acidaminococcaceae bacterium]